jgi:hypothetical protein
MEIKKILIILLFVACGCQKDLQTTEIVSELTVTPGNIDADGTSTITVSARINDKAANDKRNVVFTKTSGTWVGAKGDTLIMPAVYGDKQIVAKAILIAPSKPGLITVTAFSQALTISGDYAQTKIIQANKVEAASIILEPSALGVGSNATSEVTLTGKITGSSGVNASQGVTVVLEDYLSSGLPAGGHFRAEQLKSNSGSQISAVYSAGNLPIGTNIIIVGTIVDEHGKKTTMSSSTTLTVNLNK